MSFLHIAHNGKKATVHLDDGKSDLLDRYIDFDTGYIYYTMGKQISGKTIDPNGKTGKEIQRIAEYWVNNPDTKWSTSLFSGGQNSGCFIATAAYGCSFGKEIRTLFDVRDIILCKNQIGINIVKTYYLFSPPIAKIVAKHSLLAAVVRHLISGLDKYNLSLLKWHCHKNGHFMRLNDYAENKEQ